MKTIEIVICGRVQKVGFRACIRRIASELNVLGTVENLPDGRVLVIATCESFLLEKFLSMVYGCPRAVIRDMQIKEIPLRTFDGFSIIRAEMNINTEF